MGSRRLTTTAAWVSAASLLAASALAQETTRISTDPSGVEANGLSDWPALSGNGRFVTFASEASNLVVGDTNAAKDVFVRDRRTAEVWRVSVDSAGTQADGPSFPTAITPDGRYVAFSSEATNLVAGDTNSFPDCFVHDRTTGSTVRVSVDSAGVQGNNGCFWFGWLSDDGRLVAFTSSASNLVPGDTNGEQDVFVHDLQTGVTTRVSESSSGAEGDSFSVASGISGDGRFVTFWSLATNLVASDTNGSADAFLHELSTGMTTRLSVDAFGVEGDRDTNFSSMSRDGRFVAFRSLATNLVPGDTNGRGDIFLRDRVAGTIARVNLAEYGIQGNGDSFSPTISADGQRVAYVSRASNLVPGDTNRADDSFLYDRATDRTTRVSVRTSGEQGNGLSRLGGISADGRCVTFFSEATNLVTRDRNAVSDVFVRGPSLTLEASSLEPSAGDTLSLTTWTGLPGGLALLAVVGIDGSPRFTTLARSPFDADGQWSLTGTVPAGLSGVEVSFQSLGFVPTGKVGISDRQTIRFQ